MKDEKPKKKRKGLRVFLIIVAVFFVLTIVIVIASQGKETTAQKEPERELTEEEKIAAAAEQRKAAIAKHFSSWDGSHIALARVIKESMNDPKSYEHVKTIYSDYGDHLVVKTTFRGTNAFGGKVLGTVTAKCSLNGEVLEILEQ